MATDSIDLTSDIEAARDELAPLAQNLCGLFQLWNIFMSAFQMATGYVRDFDNLKHEAKMAFTKGIIIDYAKPWSRNRSEAISSLVNNGKIPFLIPVINSTSTHEALKELRHKMVAHIDEGYESLGVTLRGARAVNNPSNRAQDPGTLNSVFVPVTVRLQSFRGLWWIDDIEMLKEICSHIESCHKATQSELARAASELRDLCFKHIHVLQHLSDIISLEQFKESPGATPSEQKYKYDRKGELPPTFLLNPATSTILGDKHLQGLVSVFEPSPVLPGNKEIRGRGFILTLSEPNKGSVRFNVSFPKYPWPDGTPG